MENIFIYLVPIALIIAFLFPKMTKKAGQKPATQQPRQRRADNEWVGQLNELMSAGRSDMAAVQEETDEEEDDDEEEKEPVVAEPVKAGESMTRIARLMMEESEKKPEPMAEKPEEPVVPPQPRHPKTRTSPLSTSKEDLRKAIVWSEILAPPVGLREK